MSNTKKAYTYDPFEDLVLDDYEKEIEASIARDEWKPVRDAAQMKEMFAEAARRHSQLDVSKKITVRVNQGDLVKLKSKARMKNIPYQTLLGVLIRDFVEGDYKITL